MLVPATEVPNGGQMMPAEPRASDRQAFAAMVELWVKLKMGREEEFEPLASLIPTDDESRLSHFPFLVIPACPKPHDWKKLMPVVTIGLKTGVSMIKESPVDLWEVPAGPYMILRVDDGKKTMGLSQEEGLEVIATQGRQPLTLLESWVLAVLSPVLLTHSIYASGSRIQETLYPTIYKHSQGPTLYGLLNGPGVPRYATPSCQERRGL